MIYIIFALVAVVAYVVEGITGDREQAHPARPWMD